MSLLRVLGVAALLLLGCERKHDTRTPQFTAQWCDGADPSAVDPPPASWWKHPTPCPPDTELAVSEAQGLRFDLPMPQAPLKGELRCVRADGTAHGPATGFYESGRRQRSGCFADGELHGRWHHFDEPGALVQSSVFAAGLPTGTWERYDDGGLDERRVYASPIEALVTEYDRGRRVLEGRMVDGVRQGKWLVSVEHVEPHGMSARLDRRTQTVAVQFHDGASGGARGMFGAPGCDAWLGAMLQCIRALPVDATRVQIGHALELVTVTADLHHLLRTEPSAERCAVWHGVLTQRLAQLGCAPEPV